jgi:aminopeptidase N
MENWGLNTYREGRLLYLEGKSTIEDKVRMTTTISHELAHQWFGNLVTMDWWNDIWLNEGFATYVAALGVLEVFPEYCPMEALLVNSIQPAMQMDVSATTHPISPDRELVNNETDISALFSTIVYNKGASIIRMANAFLQDDNLLFGLQEYLDTWQYKNTVQENLFDSLDVVANKTGNWPEGLTVNEILTTWTKQSGYPLVRVSLDGTTISFTQEKFNDPTADARWWIPVTFVRVGYFPPPDTIVNVCAVSKEISIDTLTKVWFNDTVSLPFTIPPNQWVLVNPTQIGNYRVLYEEANYVALKAQLDTAPEGIDAMSKSALLDDYFNFAFSDVHRADSDLSKALGLTNFLAKETHFVPWITFLTNMAHSYRMLGRMSTYLNYRTKMLSLIKPPLALINMTAQEGDTPGDQILLRTRLVEWACNLGDPDCITFAKDQFSQWRQTPNPAPNNKINPDLRTTIYCAAIANGGDTEWDFVVARYADATNATSSKYLPDVARISLIRALGCAKQSYRLAKLLDTVLSQNSWILPEHKLTAVQSVAGNSAGVALAFNFLRNNFETIVRRLGVQFFASSLSTLSNYMNTALETRDLETFYQANNVTLTTVKSSIEASIANVKKNVDWLTFHNSPLATWAAS